MRSKPQDSESRVLAFGQVVLANGQPVADSKVWLVTGNYDSPDTVAEGTTDVDGRFRFEDSASRPLTFPHQSPVWVWAEHAEHGMGWCSSGAGKNTEAVEVQLQPTVTFEVRLVDVNGQPVSDATVTPVRLVRPRKKDSGLGYATLSPAMRQSRLVTSDSQGICRLVNLPATGKVVLNISAAGFGTSLATCMLAKPLTVTLQPGTDVTGFVSWPADIDLNRADKSADIGTASIVVVRSAPGGLGSETDVEFTHYQSVPVKSDGTFVFKEVPPDRYRLMVSLDDELPLLSPGAQFLNVVAGTPPQPLALTTGQALRISGKVVAAADDSSVAGAIIQLNRIRGGKQFPGRRQTTDAAGQYSMNIGPGTYQIEVVETPNGYASLLRNRIPTMTVTGDVVWPDLKLDATCDVEP